MFLRRQSSDGGGNSSGGPMGEVVGRWLDEGPHCIQLMKRLVKALCYRSHKNCLANTDFNFLKHNCPL